MKGIIAFLFFMLFLAGIAFVNLRGMQDKTDTLVTSAEQLVVRAWRPTHFGETVVDEETSAFLQFNYDGSLTGHGGCNRVFGSYELNDSKLVFGMIGSTRMACPEPINSLEIAFIEALGNTSSALRVDNRLVLKDDQDRTILRFIAIDRVGI